MQKVVVIGTGPAGLTAALYTARANLNPIIIEGMQPGGQLTTTTKIENYPKFSESVTGTTLVEEMRKQAARFGARYVQGEVVSSDFSDRPLRLTLSNKEVVQTNAVVIATGASARYLGLESEQKLIGRGVSVCATCDGAFYRDREVAVIGGGDGAMDALETERYLSSLNV